MSRAGKTTQRGLGENATDGSEVRRVPGSDAKDESEVRQAQHTCPPPSTAKKRGRAKSKSTLRRHGSSPSAVDTDDLAVAVARPTPSSRPRAARGSDVAKAPLDPREAFVLSLVDGSMTASEIADISGMSQADIMKILQKLIALRLVTLT
jgi:hypothetical protein